MADEVFEDQEQQQPDDLIKKNMIEIGKSIQAMKLASARGVDDEGVESVDSYDESCSLTKSPKVVKKADKIRKLSARFEAGQ